MFSSDQAAVILQMAQELIAGVLSARPSPARRTTVKLGRWRRPNSPLIGIRTPVALDSQYQARQGRMRIVPITYMNAHDDPAKPWDKDVLMGIVATDLDRIKKYLERGWGVLGWQNQATVGNPKHPYALCGRVAGDC